MSNRTRMFVSLATAALFMLPAATAWELMDRDRSLATRIAARTSDLAPDLDGAAADIDASADVACALGDLDGDGADDLLVRVHEAATGTVALRALKAPDFKEIAWEVRTRADVVLECAPDLDSDGLADPVLSVVAETKTDAQGNAMRQDVTERALRVLSGANGEVLLQRVHQDTLRSTGTDRAQARSELIADLEPASAGAEAFLRVERDRSVLFGLGGAAPFDALNFTARSNIEFEIIDARGMVAGTIEIDEPGVHPLAIAPVPNGRALPDVIVLTAEKASPAHEAYTQIPTLARYNADGSLAWQVELEATQGHAYLLPRAGDLDLDGVEEMIVNTVPTSVKTKAASSFTVRSGLDGRELLGSGEPVDGLLAAVPLGEDVTGMRRILTVAHAEGAATATLKAMDVKGKVSWTAQIAANAVPTNLQRDAFTGDVLGFTDLTGDGLPDVGTMVTVGKETTFSVVNGADGKVAWTTKLESVTEFTTMSPTADLGARTDVNATLTMDFVAITETSTQTVVTVLDGATGEVVWRATAARASGTAAVDVAIEAAGDVDADGVQDLLTRVKTVSSSGTVEESLHVLSGLDGKDLFAASMDGSSAVKFDHEEVKIDVDRAAAKNAGAPPQTPGFLAWIAVTALLAAFAARRRRA